MIERLNKCILTSCPILGEMTKQLQKVAILSQIFVDFRPWQKETGMGNRNDKYYLSLSELLKQ